MEAESFAKLGQHESRQDKWRYGFRGVQTYSLVQATESLLLEYMEEHLDHILTGAILMLRLKPDLKE